MEYEPGSSSTSLSPSITANAGRTSDQSDYTAWNTQLSWRSHEERSFSKSSRIIGSNDPKEALKSMKEVLDTLWENDVQGPQLFRLDSEFGLELGSGAQFQVTGPSPKHIKTLQIAHNATSDVSLRSTLRFLSSSVVKRARYTSEPSDTIANVSRHNPNIELHSQLGSAKKEIDRLCHRVYKNHANIVRLRGWGLCLDTFEATTPLNTRIPLLILERATCDLGDFLASSNYQSASYEMLINICMDIGAGLGALHRGDVTHGDMKPENVLLFAEVSSAPSSLVWTAKLCDFGCAEVRKNVEGNEGVRGKGHLRQVNNSNSSQYDGTYGWTPPEALLDQLFDFEGLKRCDIFVYGLIVWRMFARQKTRGDFDIGTKRRGYCVAPVIEDETKIKQYLRDQAYKDAAAEVRKAFSEGLRHPRTSYIPSRFDTNLPLNMQGGLSGDEEVLVFVEKKIPSIGELRRILRVLRAALQPVPKYRDPRPWKYFDRVYYPTFRTVDERPGQDSEELSSVATRIPVPPTSYMAQFLLKSGTMYPRLVLNHCNMVLRGMGQLLPSLTIMSPRQKVFRDVFQIESARVPLGSDINSIDTIEHSGDACHDLVLFQSALHSLCQQTGSDQDSNHLFRLYSYARLRSKFKYCCWESSLRKGVSFNATQILLCHNRVWLQYAETVVIERLMKVVSWLTYGEIGKEELTVLSSSNDNTDSLWSWTFLPKGNTSEYFFHLFLERGCFIGCESTSVYYPEYSFTPLGKYLRILTRALVKADFNRMRSDVKDMIIEACIKTKQTSVTCLALITSKDANVQELINAKKRFFFLGESPDNPDGEGSVVDETATREILATTLLHEAVRACCYDAVEYFVTTATIPLVVRDKNGENALDLALRLQVGQSSHWQSQQLDLIIGLLSQKSKRKNRALGLPLGWEEVLLENDLIAYRESTINPNNPSLTFDLPKFSLLQETKVKLGSSRAAGGSLTYKFDLVRFMRASKVDETKPLELEFGA